MTRHEGIDAEAAICWSLFALALTALATHFVAYARGVVEALLYPYGLDYGEGIVWQQAVLIPNGDMYGDITRFPFVVFHYPPLYHLAVRAVATLGPGFLAAGRGVSLTATIAAAVLCGSIAFAAARGLFPRRAALVGAVLAGLIFLCCWPVVLWSPLMRVDMLAVALSLLGVWLATLAGTRPWALDLAAVAFTAAVFTKQTSIAAPVATMAVMVLAFPRRTIQACVIGTGLALGALGVLSWATEGQFLRHVVLYNVNRFSLQAAIDIIIPETAHLGFALCAAIALITLWRRLGLGMVRGGWGAMRLALRANASARAGGILALYLGISTAMLVLVGKSGATINYFIEWMAVLSTLAGLGGAAALTAGTAPGRRSRGARFVALAAPLVVVVNVSILPVVPNRGTIMEAASRDGLRLLVERIRAAPGPVLSDDMVLLMLAGKPVPWESSIFAELASLGRWDEHLITDMIRSHRFAFALVQGHEGEAVFDSRYTPAVRAALREAYPHAEQVEDHTLLTP